MMCPQCYAARQEMLVIGRPVELQCEYCGSKWQSDEKNRCLECEWFWCERDEEDGSQFYRCHFEGRCPKEDE